MSKWEGAPIHWTMLRSWSKIMSQSVTQKCVWVNFVERGDLVWRWARTLYGIPPTERGRGHHIGAEMSPRLLVGKSSEAHCQCCSTKWQAIRWERECTTMVSSVSWAILRLRIPNVLVIRQGPRLGQLECKRLQWNNAVEWVRFCYVPKEMTPKILKREKELNKCPKTIVVVSSHRWNNDLE